MEEKKVKLSKKLKELTSMPIANESPEKQQQAKKRVSRRKKIFDTNEPTEKTYVIPLGGLEEVGKNMTAFMYKDEMIIVDAGLSFPSDEHLGIDLIIPNISYLEANVNKIKALLITHGHEDHIGAIPFLYQKLGNHIEMYGTKLSLALAKSKFEKKDIKKPKTHTAIPRKVIKISKYFTAEFISITHSIADSCAICIRTPGATIVHTGDFKIDLSPVKGDGFDFAGLSKLGEQGVDLLLSDSTNSLVPGYTPSEKTVGKNIDEEVSKAKGRVILAAFASHVHRIQQIINVAVKYDRKIAIDGRSMLKIFDICEKLGYLDVPKDIIIDISQAEKMKDDKVMVICTGTQGEPLAALSRIANGTHKYITLRNTDTVIISSTPIPGNEKATSKNVNQLLKKQADVVFEKSVGVHVSGHASQEEQKLMLNLIKPTFFMPVHGEYSMLKKHKESAIMTGVKPENVILAENGFKIALTHDSCKVVDKVPAGLTLIDGSRINDVGNSILKDRQSMADDGIFVANIPLYKTGKFGDNIEIVTKGFVYVKDAEQLLSDAKEMIKLELRNIEGMNLSDKTKMKQILRKKISDYLYKKTDRSPMILPIILEV